MCNTKSGQPTDFYAEKITGSMGQQMCNTKTGPGQTKKKILGLASSGKQFFYFSINIPNFILTTQIKRKNDLNSSVRGKHTQVNWPNLHMQ